MVRQVTIECSSLTGTSLPSPPKLREHDRGDNVKNGKARGKGRVADFCLLGMAYP